MESETTLVQDPKGRWVSPTEAPLDDALPEPLTPEQLQAILDRKEKVPSHTNIQFSDSVYPPLVFAEFMCWDADELVALAQALSDSQHELDKMLRVKAEQNDHAAVKGLLEARASPIAGNFPLQPQKGSWEIGNRNALHLACYEGAVDVIPLLLAARADPSAVDDCSNTAFQVACEAAHGGKRVAKTNTAGIKKREQAAYLLEPNRAIPEAEEIQAKLSADVQLARQIGPRREVERRTARARLLQAELEFQEIPQRLDTIDVLFSPARDCTWEQHWYCHAARALKAACGSEIRCVMQWTEEPSADEKEAMSARIAASGGSWKEWCIQNAMGAGQSSVVVGHSSGGTAALRVAERMALRGVIAIGAGYTADDYAVDQAARKDAAAAGVEPDPRFIIPPWDYQKILANTGFVLLIHGEDDDVVSVAESQTIAAGLKEAAKSHNLNTDKVTLITQQGLGHAMEKRCPTVIFDAVMDAVKSRG